MKKVNNKSKITLLIIAASITVLLFSACGSKSSSSSSTTKTTNSTNQANTTNSQPSPDSMKTVFTNALKVLVSDSTITQTQLDKVLEAITKDMPENNGAQPPTANDTSSNTNAQGTDKPSGTPPSGTPPTGTDKQGSQPQDGKNPISEKITSLVSSGVITQAQADKINTKITEAMKSSQNTTTKTNN